MQLHQFNHESEVKAGCCNWETSTTYWLAESRAAAESEIKAKAEGEHEPHGLCAHCMAEFMVDNEFEVTA